MRKAYALSAVLVACYLCNYLCGDITGCGKAVRLLNKSLAYYSTVLKHILKVYKIAVMHMLCKIIRIMEVNDTLFMRFNYIHRKKKPSCKILADLACHIVTLNAVYSRVLVGVFLLCLFIITFDKAQYLIISRI